MLLVAALSAIVVVGVYEVRARLAKHHPESPSEAKELEPSEPPAPTEVSPARFGQSCGELRRLYLSRCPLDLPTPEKAIPAPNSESNEEEARISSDLAAWQSPNSVELGEMAKRCEVRFEMPAITENQAPHVTDEASAALSLSSGERGLLEQTLSDMHARLRGVAEQAFLEAGGPTSKPSELSLEEILSDLQTRPENGFEQAREKLARERAGLASPPQSGLPQPPGERLLRMWATVGDQFEQRLASELGNDRARQLRSSPQAVWMNRFSHSGCRAQPEAVP
jgi:hypothetical protein